MRKIATLCTLGLLMSSSSLFPVESSARSLPAATASSADNILPVVSNKASGIRNANYTATLSDNTVLGFNIYYSQVYFCGAVSSAKSIEVPDTISYNSKKYPVKTIGYNSGSHETLDFSKAEKVTSLTLPATVSNIYSYLPTTVKEVHLQSVTPPSLGNSDFLSDDVTIFVPQDLLTTYLNYCSNSNNGWRTSHDVHMEGWVPQSYSLNISTAGTMAYKLLEVVNQWTDVDELTISGHLNAEDMKYFSRMTQLRKLDLSQTDIASIGGCNGLTRLREVILPSTVTEIEDNAFDGCVCLSNIAINNVESIGAYAFYNCSRISSLNMDKVMNIDGYAFYNGSLTSLSLPKIETIGSSAFRANYKLASAAISNAQEIGDEAFAHCDSLSEVSIPNVVKLGDRAFCNISKLKKVTLSDKLETIPSYAFAGCRSLEEINFPKALKDVGYQAIEYLSGDVRIPEGVEVIGSYNFKNSTSITLPSTLTNVSYLGGTNLQDVYCNVVIPLTSKGFSENVASQATLHVPAFSVSAYKLADAWYHFNSIVALDSKLSDITFNNTFVLMDQKGLAEKANFTLKSSINNSDRDKIGHLTVATDSPMALGTFTQEENFYSSYDYIYDDNGNEKRVYTYPYASTLISNSDMTADEVTVKMSLPQNQWSFISLPFDVNVSDIEFTEGTLWVIRKYNGANRAAMTGDTWQNVVNGQTLNAGEGYILHCSNNDLDYYTYPTFTFKAANNAKKNGIFAHTDVETPLKTYASEFAHNRSWNLVGNPYPAFFDTQNIEHEGVITAWNGNGYTAYSLVDDDYRLHPNEAFFVQCPVNASSMTFKAEGRTHDSSMKLNDEKTRARALAKDGSARSIYNLEFSDAQYTDKARLVLNENAQMEYELSCDASKFMSSNTSVPQIYIIENGEKMAIDERPLSTGIITLGVYCGTAGKHIIALATAANEDRNIALLDKETGVETNLLNGKYEFEAAAGSYENRFVLNITRGTTGINQQVVDAANGKKTIYNLNGQKLSTPQSGVNIINNQKILVK